jgi:hypothetical protein
MSEIKIQGDTTLEGDVYIFYKTQLEFQKEKDMYALKKKTDTGDSNDGLKNISFIFKPSSDYGLLEKTKYYVVNSGDTIYENRNYDEFKLFQDPKIPGIVKLLYENHEHEKNQLLTEHKQIEDSLKGMIESMQENMNNLETEVQKKYETEIKNASIIPPFVDDKLLVDINKNMSDVKLIRTKNEIETYLNKLTNLKDKIATLSTNVNSKLNETDSYIRKFNEYKNQTNKQIERLTKYASINEILSEFNIDEDISTLDELNNNTKKINEMLLSDILNTINIKKESKKKVSKSDNEDNNVMDNINEYLSDLYDYLMLVSSHIGIKTGNDGKPVVEKNSDSSYSNNAKILTFISNLIKKIYAKIDDFKKISTEYTNIVNDSSNYKNINEIFKIVELRRDYILRSTKKSNLQLSSPKTDMVTAIGAKKSLGNVNLSKKSNKTNP